MFDILSLFITMRRIDTFQVSETCKVCTGGANTLMRKGEMFNFSQKLNIFTYEAISFTDVGNCLTKKRVAPTLR